VLGELARTSPLLPGKDVLAFVDIDAQQKRVYGHKKQGAGFGHTKIQGKSLLVRGLNAPPVPWPASPTPKPAAPHCAATSLTSPPGLPATAAATSPCTCPKTGTASRNG